MNDALHPKRQNFPIEMRERKKNLSIQNSSEKLNDRETKMQRRKKIVSDVYI